MNWLLIILGLILVAALAIADYKWRQWMAARRRDRDTPSGR
jgi:predicted outer membrane lipoprotein